MQSQLRKAKQNKNPPPQKDLKLSFVTSVSNMRKPYHSATGKSESVQPMSWVGALCCWDCVAGLGNSSYFLAIVERLSSERAGDDLESGDCPSSQAEEIPCPTLVALQMLLVLAL